MCFGGGNQAAAPVYSQAQLQAQSNAQEERRLASLAAAGGAKDDKTPKIDENNRPDTLGSTKGTNVTSTG